MKKNKDKTQKESRLGAVGGQAVLEGVMMKAKNDIAIAVRRENGEIVKKLKPYKSIRDKHKILNIPIIRGFVNFIEMMSMSMSTLNDSAEMLGLDEEFNDKKDENPDLTENTTVNETTTTETKKADAKDAKPEKKSGSGSMVALASIVGTVLGFALSFGLFFFLPTFIGNLIKTAIPKIADMGWVISIIEGITRLAIFVVYILLVSLLKEIKRTFQYHGAEHMCVFCYEDNKELTVENVRKYSRFHPRCGTSFLVVMMIIGVIISAIIPSSFGFWLRLTVKFAIFPFVIGIGYEFIRFAGKHDSVFVRIVSAPGLWIQRLTTKKPDDLQLAVAVASLRVALRIDPVEEIPEEIKEVSEVIENE